MAVIDKTMADYTMKGEEATKKFLDAIDLKPYLRGNDEFYEVMSHIEDDFYEQVKDDPYMKGYVFNHMADEEFYDYLVERYGEKNISRREITKIYIKLRDDE